MSAPHIVRKGFEGTLDAARPDHWELVVASMDGSYESILEWPDSKDATLEELLTSAGITPGTYRIEARRIDNGQADDTHKKARTRLRKHGPLSTVYDHGAANSMSATPPTKANGAAQKVGAGPDPEIAELQRQRQRDLAEAAALNARRNLERAQRESESPRDGSNAAAELERLRYEMLRELDRIRTEQKPQASSVAPMLTALAPLLQACVTTMMQGAQRRDELLFSVFSQQGSSGTETSGTGVDVMAGVLPLIRQVVELGQEIGGGGAAGEERGMLADAASIVGVLGQLRDGVTPADPSAETDPTQTQPQPRRLPTAEEAVKLRVLQWLATVQEYLQGDADPYAAADLLAPGLGLLPGAFRELLTTGNDVDTVLAGLAKWMPRPLHERLNLHVRSSDAARVWLTAFLDGLLPDDGSSDDESTDDASGEPWTHPVDTPPAVEKPAVSSEAETPGS